MLGAPSDKALDHYPNWDKVKDKYKDLKESKD